MTVADSMDFASVLLVGIASFAVLVTVMIPGGDE